MSRAFLLLTCMFASTHALAAQYFVCETDSEAPESAPAVAIAGKLEHVSGPLHFLGDDLYFQVGEYVAESPLTKTTDFVLTEDTLTMVFVDAANYRAFSLDAFRYAWSDLPLTLKGTLTDHTSNESTPILCRAE